MMTGSPAEVLPPALLTAGMAPPEQPIETQCGAAISSRQSWRGLTAAETPFYVKTRGCGAG